MSVETTSEHGGESEEAAYDLDPSDRLANLIFYWREREKKKLFYHVEPNIQLYLNKPSLKDCLEN